MLARKWRVDLVTIGIPLPDLVTRYGYEMLRVYGREPDMIHTSLLFDDVMALSCLDIPQTDYRIGRP